MKRSGGVLFNTLRWGFLRPDQGSTQFLFLDYKATPQQHH